MERFTCIVADDHDVVRAGTRIRLEPVEWLEIVGEAAAGDEAIDLIRQLQPHLALVDLRLPRGDGAAVARAVQREGLPTRVVIFSGFGNTALASNALDAGASGYVLKEAPISVLVEALRVASEGRRYLDPTLAAEMLGADTRTLSPREREILKLMADGMQNNEIAFKLSISSETVKAHVSSILGKFDADTRTEAVAKALRGSVIE